MNYIIDVKAQLLNNGGNLKTQYMAVKKDIERQVINVKAVLDPNELSLKAIQKQLNDQKLTLNIANVEFNQSATRSSIDKTASTISNQLSKAMSTMNVTGFNKGNYSSLLRQMGLDDDSIKKATESVQKLGITITKISGTDYGTDAKGNNTISAIIQGEDKLGRVVTLSQKIKVAMDESGNELIDFSNKVINVTDNIKQQAQAQERANKAYVRQKKLIDDAAASAKEMWAAQNRNNPIKDVTNNSLPINGVSSLSADYDKITPKTKEFVEAYNEWVKIIRTANDELKTQGKISSETELALRSAEKAAITLSRDVTKERSTQTDFRSKDVSAEVEKAKTQLVTFERELEQVGMTLDDLRNKNGQTLREVLNNVSDSNSFSEYLNQLGIAKAKLEDVKKEQQYLANQKVLDTNFTNTSVELDNLVKKIKELDIDESKLTYSTKDLYESFDSISDTKGLQALKSMISQTTKEVNEQQKAFEVEKAKIGELVKLQEQITSQQTKIANAELSGKNHNDIDIMKNKLEELEVTYEKLVTEFVSNPLFLKLTTSDLEPLNNASGNNEYVNNILNAKKLEEAWYQELLSKRKEINSEVLEELRLMTNISLYDKEEVQRLSGSIIPKLVEEERVLQEIAKSELTETQFKEVENRLHKDTLEMLKKRLGLMDSIQKTQAKEADSMLSDVNKNTNKASNSLTNTKDIEILSSEYSKLVEIIKKFKSEEDFSLLVPNQREATAAIENYKNLISTLLNAESKFKSVGNSLEQLDKQTSGGVFSANSTDKGVIALNEKIEILKNNYQGLMAEFNDVGATNEVIQGFDNLAKEIDSTSQKANELNKTFRSTRTETTLISQKQSLNKSIETWLKNNTKASEAMKQSMKALQVQIESADNQGLKNLRNEFKRLKDVADATGQTGMKALDNFKEKIGKFSSWFGVSQLIMGAVNDTKEAIVTLKEVDSILTEISKTSDMSEESLKRLGTTAFESANQYGVTVQSFLTGVQEMSRAGYQDAEGMANLSILAQAAGDMTEEVADKYLIATDAAYKFNGSIDDLGKVLGGQNQITNRYAISMTDMASATQEAASMAANYGVSIEQLSALITTAVASTRQSGSEVGNALSTLFVNLSDTTNKERMKAFDTLGVSVYKFVDGAQKLKTPIELLD